MPRGMPRRTGCAHAGECVVAGAFACGVRHAAWCTLHYVLRGACNAAPGAAASCAQWMLHGAHLRDDLVLGRKFYALVRVRDVHEIVDRRGPVCARARACARVLMHSMHRQADRKIGASRSSSSLRSSACAIACSSNRQHELDHRMDYREYREYPEVRWPPTHERVAECEVGCTEVRTKPCR